MKLKAKEKEKEKERAKLNYKGTTQVQSQQNWLFQIRSYHKTTVSLCHWKDIDLGSRQESSAFAKVNVMEKKAMMRVMENVIESKTESVSASAIVRCHFQTQLQSHTKGKPNANEEIAPTMKVAPFQKNYNSKTRNKKRCSTFAIESEQWLCQSDGILICRYFGKSFDIY
ncbi:hypothetical protein RFI_33081, partial [Reticulomyxa filosa]